MAALVAVMFHVDPSGAKSGCVASEAAGFEKVNNHPALVSLACPQLMSRYQATPATDAAG